MTAPLLNLPISAPAAPGGGGQAAPTGTASALGFETLIAAFFATGEGEAGAGPLGEGDKTDGDGDTEAQATDGAPVAPVDAQTLAALLAVTPQPTQAATPVATEAGQAEAPPAGAPPVAFSPLLAQEIATTPAPPTDVTKNVEAEAAPVETALVDTPDTSAAARPALAEAKPAPAETAAPQSQQVAREQQSPAATPQTQATAPAPVQTTAAPQTPPPAQAEAATDPLVQAQAVATEVETPAEPVKDHAPARTAKTDAGRRNAAAAPQTAPAASASNDTPVAAPAVDAETFGEAAAAIDGEPAAAPTSGEAKSQAADAPDAQGPATTAAATNNAAGAIVDAPLPVRGSPETVAHLSAQIVKKLEGRSTHFDVELNPAGLGHVTVSVEIGAQGKMTAALQFESAQAANELRGRAPELQKALEQAGFDLSGGGLSFDVAGDRGGQNGRGDLYQQQQQQNDGAWRGRAFQAVLDTADGVADAAAAASLHLQRRVVTGVDVRV